MPRTILSGDDERALLVIGANVTRVRELFKLSGRALARKSGVSAGRLNKLEAGQSEPSVVLLLRLARAFGVSVDVLLKDVV